MGAEARREKGGEDVADLSISIPLRLDVAELRKQVQGLIKAFTNTTASGGDIKRCFPGCSAGAEGVKQCDIDIAPDGTGGQRRGCGCV